MKFHPRACTRTMLALLTSVALAACNSSGNGIDENGNGTDENGDGDGDSAAADSESAAADTAQARFSEGIYTAVASALDKTEVGDSGPVFFGRVLGKPAMSDSGYITFNSGLRSLDYEESVGGTNYFLVPPGSDEPEPYLSRLLVPGEFDGDDITGSPPRHGPAEDGSVVALVTVGNGADERPVALKYKDGDHEILFDSQASIPGLPGYSFDSSGSRSPDLVRNPEGDMALRLYLRDQGGDSEYTWLRSAGDEFEIVMRWGEVTPNPPYVFEWPQTSRPHSAPAIHDDGTITFYAKSRRELPEEHEADISSFQALWEQGSTANDELDSVIHRHQIFIDQTTGITGLEVGQFTSSNNNRYSRNNDGELALIYERNSDDKAEIVFRDAAGIRILAHEDLPAPNLDTLGQSTGALFDDLGNPVLSDSGLVAFTAEVTGKTSLWVYDGGELKPVIMEGMETPEGETATFDYIGSPDSPYDHAPLINNQGQVVFWAYLDHDGSQTRSLWSWDACNGVSLIAAEDQRLEVGGLPAVTGWNGDEAILEPHDPTERIVDRLEEPYFAQYPASGPNAGGQRALTNTGDFVFGVRFQGDKEFDAMEPGDTGMLMDQRAILGTNLPGCAG